MDKIRSRRATVLTFVAVLLSASPLALSTSGYNNVTITLLTIYQSGHASAPGALIQFSPITPSDLEACSHSGQGYAWIDYSATGEPDGKALYATAFAAQLAGKQIGIGVGGCSPAGYPVVYGINVYP